MIYIIVEGGLVQEVRSAKCHVIDCDNFENGVCPVCNEDLEDYICPYCKTDWSTQKMNYDELIKIANRKFVCQHAEHEDCMSCQGCMDGVCREDLNDDDLCPECEKEIILESLLTYLRESEEECFCEDNGGSCAKCLIERFDELGGLQ